MFKRVRQWLERLPWIGDAFYWIRANTYNRYHMINISGQDGYTWGWIDRDRAIMLACFKLLCDYVEQESHHIDWDEGSEHRECKATMHYLYNWWKVERPRRQKDIEEFCNNNPSRPFSERSIKNDYGSWTLLPEAAKEREIQEQFNKMDSDLEQEEDDNLIKLMKIRRALWS
jgi:hypothetical protein